MKKIVFLDSYFVGVFENLLNFCRKTFADNILPKNCKTQICKLIFVENFIKNTNLRIKIQNIYILHTNKFGKDNAKYCSQKTKL